MLILLYYYVNIACRGQKRSLLARIIGVEALTEDEKEIPSLKKRVTETMHLLGLKELDPDTYQNMMDEMYETLMKPVEEQDFHNNL